MPTSRFQLPPKLLTPLSRPHLPVRLPPHPGPSGPRILTSFRILITPSSTPAMLATLRRPTTFSTASHVSLRHGLGDGVCIPRMLMKKRPAMIVQSESPRRRSSATSSCQAHGSNCPSRTLAYRRYPAHRLQPPQTTSIPSNLLCL